MIDVDIDLQYIALGFCARRLIKSMLGAEPGHIGVLFEFTYEG